MTRSEAGKLGWQASLGWAIEAKKQRIASYDLNPKLCGFCKKTLPYSLRRSKFCDRSCAACAKHGRAYRRQRYAEGKRH